MEWNRQVTQHLCTNQIYRILALLFARIGFWFWEPRLDSWSVLSINSSSLNNWNFSDNPETLSSFDYFTSICCYNHRRILWNYLAYDHGCRSHLSLNKDAPEEQVQELAELGMIRTLPMIGGFIIATPEVLPDSRLPQSESPWCLNSKKFNF